MRRKAGLREFVLERLESRDTPAAVGTLDPSFGTAGKTTVDFGALNDDVATAAALQPDGKLVVVGGTGLPGGSDFVVTRLNPDGTLDGSFGGGSGKFIIDFTGFDRATAVALQPDGKIIVAGNTAPSGAPQPGVTPDMAVARVNADGTIDTSFNGSGGIHIDLGGNETASGVAVRSDGRIVVVGTSGSDFAVVQLTTTGGYDPSFKGSGKTTYDFGGTESADAVALQSNGLAVVAGTTSTGGGVANNFAVLRIDAAGNPDAGFGGGDGMATVDFGFNDKANAVALDSVQRIILAGVAAGTSDDFAVARLNTDGSRDNSFGANGITIGTFGAADRGHAVAIQPDGKVVVAGSTDAGNGDMGVIRLLANGSPDTSFGTSGATKVDFGTGDAANAVALSATGRVYLIGTTGVPGNFAIARLIGSVEEGRNLGVSGPLDGGAVVYRPNGNGNYLTSPSFSVAPFGAFSGNVRTAIGDVNGDGVQDTVVVSGPGIGVRFAAISGTDNSTFLISPTAAFAGSADFTGGCFVDVGDFDGDGHAEIVVTPDLGGGSRVSIYSLLTGGLFLRANFLAFPGDANFRGGVRPAIGDVNGDGTPDLAIAAGFLGGPRVGLFDGRTLFTTQSHLVNDFFAFPGDDAIRLRNGVYVAASDVNGDGFADLTFGGGPGGAPRVFVMSGQLLMAGGTAAYDNPIANFFVAGASTNRGGIRVANTDVDGDNLAEVAVGTGQNTIGRARVYFGRTFGTGTGEPGGFQDFDPFNSPVLGDGIYVG